MLLCLFVEIIVSLCLLSCKAAKLDYHSFEAPFSDVDHSGNRIVSRHWRTSGVTTVASNYIRLTPDRQSKKGALWSRKALNVPEFSSILKFRISGQGKNFFGDGLAYWIVQQGYYNEGSLHGFQEKFIGIGIIFDTFKNTESIASHRDVTVLVNDGEKTIEMMTADVQGCNINVRYHNDRADFSVLDASRAKVILDENSFALFVDARNSGEWTPCVNITNLPFIKPWLRKAHLGLTATTGQLADNHDVLSLMSYSDHAVLEEDEQEALQKKFFDVMPDDTHVEDRLKRIEEAINAVMQKNDFLEHHLEHELDGITNQVDQLKLSIERLEAGGASLAADGGSGSGADMTAVKKDLDNSLTPRITKLEKSIKDEVNRKIARMESTIDKYAGKGGLTGGGEGWKWPFFFLLLLVLSAMIAMYFFYQHLLKKWKLP